MNRNKTKMFNQIGTANDKSDRKSNTNASTIAAIESESLNIDIPPTSDIYDTFSTEGKNINEIFEHIQKRMTRLNELEKSHTDKKKINCNNYQYKLEPNSDMIMRDATSDNMTLTMNDTQITVSCMLHIMSEDSNFFIQKKDKCSQNIQNYLNSSVTGSRKLTFNKLMQLSDVNSNDAWKKDVNFYYNLYDFNICLLRAVKSNHAILNKAGNEQIKRNIIGNLRIFVLESIVYTKKFVNKYKVVNQTIMQNTLDLLYILHILTSKKLKSDPNLDLDKLKKLTQQLEEVLGQNIQILSNIDINRLQSNIDNQERLQQSTISAAQVKPLEEQVKKKIEELKGQWKTYSKKYSEMEKNENNLYKNARGTVQSLGKELQKV